MKTSETINPSAFPDPMRGTEQIYNNQDPNSLGEGMTLRDYFAAKAMQGVLSNPQFIKDIQSTAKIKKMDDDDTIALFSFAIADAMLKQREL